MQEKIHLRSWVVLRHSDTRMMFERYGHLFALPRKENAKLLAE
jgi:hypothetical protein